VTKRDKRTTLQSTSVAPHSPYSSSALVRFEVLSPPPPRLHVLLPPPLSRHCTYLASTFSFPHFANGVFSGRDLNSVHSVCYILYEERRKKKESPPSQALSFLSLKPVIGPLLLPSLSVSKKMAASKRTKVSICFALVGVICVVLGFVMSEVILQKLREGIADKVSIHSNMKSSDFKDWSSTERDDAPAKYWKIRFYNLTNPETVLDGGDAIMEETKPYVFRQYQYYWNATFEDSNKKVKAISRKRLVPECPRGEECGDLNDEIVSLYPSYVAAVGFAGSKQNLQVALSGASQQIFWQLISFYAQIKGAAFPGCEGGKYTGVDCLINQITGYPGATSMFDNADFRSFVCGAIKVVKPYQGESFCELVTYVHENPSAKKPELGLALGQSGQSLPFSVVKNMVLGTMPGGGDCKCGLLQTSAVVGDPADIPCGALLAQLGLAQNYKRIAEIWPQLAKVFETNKGIYFWLAITFSGQGDNLLQAAGKIAGALPVATKDNFMWAKRNPQAWLFKFTDPFMVFSKPKFVPSDLDTSYFGTSNYSSNEEQLTAGSAQWDEYFTGKGNLDNAKSYTSFQEMSVLKQKVDPHNARSEGFFCNGDAPVYGHDNTQFKPGTNHFLSFGHGVRKFDHPKVFVPEVFRAIGLDYVKTVKVHGIDTYRFRVSNKELTPDIAFDSTHGGILNITCPRNGVPVALTLPHQIRTEYDTDCNVTSPSCFTEDWWYGGITRLNSTHEVLEKYETYVDIDPITGATLRGMLRLQINMIVKASDGFGKVKIENGMKLIPILWVEQTSQLTSKQASQYKDKIWMALRMQKGMLYGLTIGGTLLSLFCIAIACISSKKSGYTSVQYEQYEESLLAPGLREGD